MSKELQAQDIEFFIQLAKEIQGMSEEVITILEEEPENLKKIWDTSLDIAAKSERILEELVYVSKSEIEELRSIFRRIGSGIFKLLTLDVFDEDKG